MRLSKFKMHALSYAGTGHWSQAPDAFSGQSWATLRERLQSTALRQGDGRI